MSRHAYMESVAAGPAACTRCTRRIDEGEPVHVCHGHRFGRCCVRRHGLRWEDREGIVHVLVTYDGTVGGVARIVDVDVFRSRDEAMATMQGLDPAEVGLFLDVPIS